MKHCRRCGADRVLSAFAKNSARSSGLADWCRDCNRDYEDVRRGRTSPGYRRHVGRYGRRLTQGQHQEAARLRRFNLTPCELTKMRIEQGDRCALCGQSEETKSLAIDHCHETGRVRGLLCGKCNTGLGLLGDTPERLEAALAYLG